MLEDTTEFHYEGDSERLMWQYKCGPTRKHRWFARTSDNGLLWRPTTVKITKWIDPRIAGIYFEEEVIVTAEYATMLKLQDNLQEVFNNG